jgi:hypothetical protein
LARLLQTPLPYYSPRCCSRLPHLRQPPRVLAVEAEAVVVVVVVAVAVAEVVAQSLAQTSLLSLVASRAVSSGSSSSRLLYSSLRGDENEARTSLWILALRRAGWGRRVRVPSRRKPRRPETTSPRTKCLMVAGTRPVSRTTWLAQA